MAVMPLGSMLNLGRSGPVSPSSNDNVVVEAPSLARGGQPAVMPASFNEEAAMRDGNVGLRLSGSTSWLPSLHGAGVAEREARVHAAFHGRRILALCSYALERCGSDLVIDVMKSHGIALVRVGDAWSVLHSATAALAFAAGDRAPQRHGHTVEFYPADAFPADRLAGMIQRSLANLELEPSRVGALRAVAEAAITPAARR